MRTTLTVDDDLLQRAKEQAVALGVTVSDVVNRALRRGMDAPAPSADLRTLIVGSADDRGPIDIKAIAEALDDEYFRRKMSPG